MAEFLLPKNSKINSKGKEHKAAPGAKRVKTFKIYRYDPMRARIRATTSSRWISTNAARWSSTR